MSYIKIDDLFKTVLIRAICDRESFKDAVSNDENMVKETIAEIARIKALEGLTLKAAVIADKEAVRLACLNAESWYLGVADSWGNGRAANEANASYKKIRALRMKLFGATALESKMEKMVSLPIKELFAKQLAAQSA